MHADSWESISSYLRCHLKTSEKSQFYLSIPPFLGYCTETMRRQRWNVRTYNGRYGFIRLVDYGSGSWGYIAFDDLRGNIRCESKFSLFYSFVSERYKDWLTIFGQKSCPGRHPVNSMHDAFYNKVTSSFSSETEI